MSTSRIKSHSIFAKNDKKIRKFNIFGLDVFWSYLDKDGGTRKLKKKNHETNNKPQFIVTTLASRYAELG
jgi:hypothetical protein